MHNVCIDADGVSTWHYDPQEKMYYRCYDNGSHQGVIAGKFLPDPHMLWRNNQEHIQAVCAARKEEYTEVHKEKVKPSLTTFALWNHWQGVK